MKHILSVRFLCSLLLIVLCRAHPSYSFAVLTHEAIIDASWENYIKPLLRQKYPDATTEDLTKAYAFVYGGAILPDIGYYPFGSHEFSNLVHYVRSGDFVRTLLEESRNINEYGFSLGVLSHYEADRFGHSLGTNKSVAILFARLGKKYGKEVTFEQGRNQHVRVEFGFDVLQTARGNYRTDAYHNFIGFEISDSVLERAFYKTYDVHLKDVFGNLPQAISVLRYSVKVIIPELTKDAWRIKNSFITKLNPLATKENYRYQWTKNAYRKEFKQPRFRSFMVSLVIGVLPKYGALSRFKPKMPNPECERLFEQSFEAILSQYSTAITRLAAGSYHYTNIDLDTGKGTLAGDYQLADKAYFRLLMKMQENRFSGFEEELRSNIEKYYTQHAPSTANGAHSAKGKKIAIALAQLRAAKLPVPRLASSR